MARQPNYPLRALSAQERECLRIISRSYSEPAAHVARAKALLAVADGCAALGEWTDYRNVEFSLDGKDFPRIWQTGHRLGGGSGTH